MSFDKRNTSIAKGVAVLLLLWHHLFFDDPNFYSLFTSFFTIHNIPIESILARYCKVCVAIFLFLSGFGLYKSIQKNYSSINIIDNKIIRIKNQLIFLKNHLLKLMFSYWFVFIIFVPIGIFFGRHFWEIYNSNLFFAFVDFCGLSDLFSTPTMNTTWWFMSEIILLYLLFPLLFKLIQWFPEAVVVISVIVMIFPYSWSLPFIGKYFIWFPPFVLGMCFAETNGFELINLHNPNCIQKVILSISMIVLAIILRRASGNTPVYDAFFALSIIFFSFFVLSRVPFLNVFLESFGKISGLIYMFHYFIIYYFKDIIYWFKFPPLIFLVVLVVCYLIALGINYLKKLTHYFSFVSKFTS